MLFRLALAVLSLTSGLAGAEPLSLKRGVNGDLWNNWASIEGLMADPEALAIFPDWRRNVTPAMFDALADQGFDFIRLPIDPGPALAYGPGADRDRLIDGIHAAAQMGLDAGLKVIVDMHPVPRGDEVGGAESIVGDHFDAYVALVGRIAARLKDLPTDRMAFELLNEPAFDCEGVYAGEPPKWPAMQKDLHDTVRAALPDITIILTGACYGQADGLAALDPTLIPDDKLLWTFHSYAPFAFSHQGASWVGGTVKYLRDLPYPPTLMTPTTVKRAIAGAMGRMTAAEGDADAADITKTVTDYAASGDGGISAEISIVADWADKHGVPRSHVLMGEFGALHTVDFVSQPREWYDAFLSAKRKAAEEAGFGWAVLSWSGDMGIAPEGDPERRMPPSTCRALGLPCGN
jgi:endoglucanase